MIWICVLASIQESGRQTTTDPYQARLDYWASAREWREARRTGLDDNRWSFRGSAPQLTQAVNIVAILNNFLADADEGEAPLATKIADTGGKKDKDRGKDQPLDNDQPQSRWVTKEVGGEPLGYPDDPEIVFGTRENALRAAVGLLRWGRVTRRPAWAERGVELGRLLGGRQSFGSIYEPSTGTWKEGAKDDEAATACAAIDFVAFEKSNFPLRRLIKQAETEAKHAKTPSDWQCLLLAKMGRPVVHPPRPTTLDESIATVESLARAQAGLELARACEALIQDQTVNSGWDPVVDTYGGFKEGRLSYSNLTPLAGLALIRAGMVLDRQDYMERGVAALRCGFGLLKANALFGDPAMNAATIPISRMFHGAGQDEELIAPKSWAADEGQFVAAWAEENELAGTAYVGSNWKVGIDGVGVDKDGSWDHLLSRTISNMETPIDGTVVDFKGHRVPLEISVPPPFIREIRIIGEDKGMVKVIAIPSRAVSTSSTPSGQFFYGSVFNNLWGVNPMPAQIGPTGFEAEIDRNRIGGLSFEGTINGQQISYRAYQAIKPFSWVTRGDLPRPRQKDNWLSTGDDRPRAVGSIESSSFWAIDLDWSCPVWTTHGAVFEVMDAETRLPLKTTALSAGDSIIRMNFLQFSGHQIYLAFRDSDINGSLRFNPPSDR